MLLQRKIGVFDRLHKYLLYYHVEYFFALSEVSYVAKTVSPTFDLLLLSLNTNQIGMT
jgi:hypothetical protein